MIPPIRAALLVTIVDSRHIYNIRRCSRSLYSYFYEHGLRVADGILSVSVGYGMAVTTVPSRAESMLLQGGLYAAQQYISFEGFIEHR